MEVCSMVLSDLLLTNWNVTQPNILSFHCKHNHENCLGSYCRYMNNYTYPRVTE